MSSDLAVPLARGRPVKVAAAAEDGVFAVLFLDVQHGLLDPALPLLLGFLLPKLPLPRRGIVKEAELYRLLRLAQDILLAHKPVGGDGQTADRQLRVGPFVIDAEHGIYSVALTYSNRGGKILGKIGLVSHKILKRFDIDVEVSFAELNWDSLMKMAAKHTVLYSELPKFQAVKRDLALLVDQAVSFTDIEKVARESERKLLKEVYLFDVYEGKNLPEGKKSYAVSFILQDENKTLNDKQIDAIMNKIIANLQQKLEAQLR